MKAYKICFSVFTVILAVLFYPFTPVALNKTQMNPLPISKTQSISFPTQPDTLDKEALKKESNMALHHLNQKQFGVSDYEKAQKELQQFNRPDIGIVGKDSDWTSYQGYQKKILGSSY